MDTENLVLPSIRSAKADIGKKSILFQLSKAPGKVFPWYPPTEMIPAQSEILFIPEKLDENGKGLGIGDMENAEQRHIAYVQGMRSIFVDEWSDNDKDKLTSKIKSIKIINGFKSISTRDKNLLLYFRLAGYNKDNADTRLSPAVLYREVDYEAEAKKVVDLDNKKIQAQYFVNNGEISEVRAYAEALCKTQAEVHDVRTQGEHTVRYKLKELAKSSPELFVSGLTDPIMRNRLVIVRALQKDIICLSDDNKELSWANGDKVFVTAPDGMDAIAFFSEISHKNKEYTKILEAIKLLIDEKDGKVEEKLDWIDTFIKQAINVEALKQVNNWYMIPGETEDDEAILKYNGVKKLRAAIEKGEDNIMPILSMKIQELSDK